MWGKTVKDTDQRDDTFTFLGKGVDFKGVIRFEGTVRVDGRLEGEIHTNGTLIVGEHAVIKGKISAGTLVSSGRIKGIVTASEKVQLLKGAILIGETHAPLLAIEEGGHFHGTSNMGADKWQEVDAPVEAENVHDLTAHRSKVRVLAEQTPTT